MGIKKVTTTQGDTLNIIINFKDKDGSILDITGATVKIVIRDVCRELILKTVTDFTNPTLGICTISFTGEETLVWDIALGTYEVGIQLAGGDRYAVIKDVIEIKQNLIWS